MESTPAAQYLRVSTERQEYSLDCQRAGIESYARQHNISICHTYVDEAKSGLEVKHRKGLSQLLQDVLGGNCSFRSILVYDVSRWGRFQDPDEAAHYEFLCKAAGVRVYYCAEQFGNDTYLPNVVLKALKRVMAGEYSRELSDKVFAALVRLSRDGYRAGGYAGYGLRRVLLSTNKTPKGELLPGERKNVTNERVTLVPGPANETCWIREIYRMFIHEHMPLKHIANKLNQLGVPGLDGRGWTRPMVTGILKNPKYKGALRYNATTRRLHSRSRGNPEGEWILVPGAYEPVVEPAIFEMAQQEFRNRHYNWSNDQAVEALRSILKKEGRLTPTLIRSQPNALCPEGYRRRFGSLARAYELAGYESPQQWIVVHKKQIRELRRNLMENLVKLFPGEVFIQTRGPEPNRRNCLRLRNGTRVAVRTCRRKKTKYKGPTWVLPPSCEKRLITFLVCVNPENTALEAMYVLPPIANRCPVSFSEDHSWLKNGTRIQNLNEFCKAAREITRRGIRALGGGRKRKSWISEDAHSAMVMALRMRGAAKKKTAPTIYVT
jgi:DNA invertase Pin-like site-specific DNA recombinase